MKKGLYLLLLIPLLAGCSAPPVEVDYYVPVAASARDNVVVRGGYSFIEHSGKNYWLSATLIGAKKVYIVSLKVINKTSADLGPEDYSVSLADGRDAKPLNYISRESVIRYRASLAGGGQDLKSGNPMADMALTQLNNAISSLGKNQKSELLQSIDSAIEHYFAFRPIYAGEAREGVICYFPDFVLEYPLVLRVKLPDETVDFKFWPAPRRSAEPQ